MVGRAQFELAAGPDSPLPVRAVERRPASRLDHRHHVGGQGVEGGDGQPGQVPEDGGVLPQGGESGDHGGACQSKGTRPSGYETTATVKRVYSRC